MYYYSSSVEFFGYLGLLLNDGKHVNAGQSNLYSSAEKSEENR